MSARQEPYWVCACPVCKRQLRDATSQCCNGEFGKTIYCVPEDLHRGAVKALQRIERLPRKWEATPTGDRAPWAAVGSEAHKIAADYLKPPLQV
jgi:hypothetical protein